jgi:hypothetical protein
MGDFDFFIAPSYATDPRNLTMPLDPLNRVWNGMKKPKL